MSARETDVDFKAKQATQCALAAIVLYFVASVCARVVEDNAHSAFWLKKHRPAVEIVTQICVVGSWPLLVYYFSRIRSISNLSNKLGLARRPTWAGGWSVVVVLCLAGLNGYESRKGWASPNQFGREMYQAAGWAWVSYAINSILFAPFCEEVMMQGFLYRAFRTNYGPVLSTFYLVGIQSFFHHGTMSGSPYSFVCFGLLFIFLCVLREKTTSLWNCIIAHAVFNALAAFRIG